MKYTIHGGIIPDLQDEQQLEIQNTKGGCGLNTEALISIIVPCYNIAPYIENCVHTILQQTYQNIEVLLVDDGSTDGTGNLLDLIGESDKRVKVIHKTNGGVTSARFVGIEIACGEWIGFIDGDDAIEPDMYEHLLSNAMKYNAQISHCGYQMVFPSRIDYYYNTGCLAEQDKQLGLQELIAGLRIEPSLCSKLFHRTLFYNLINGGIIDHSIRNTEDLLMNFYLFREAEKSVYEDFCPYHYIVREGSAATSRTNEHKLKDPLKVLRIIQSETTDNPLLQRVVNSRIAGVLIGQATMRLDNQAELIQPYRTQARKDLQAMIPQLWKDGYSRRTRILSTWAAVWPGSYTVVHWIYAKIKGTDKKYEVS